MAARSAVVQPLDMDARMLMVEIEQMAMAAKQAAGLEALQGQQDKDEK